MAAEDLHWFDASSLELVQLLVEQAATARVMLICTARPEFHAPWAHRTNYAHLTLNRLTARDVREVVEKVVPTNSLSGEAIDKEIERTGDVPLIVGEMTA